MEKVITQAFQTSPDSIYGLTLGILLTFICILFRIVYKFFKEQQNFIKYERQVAKDNNNEIIINTKTLIKSNEELNEKLGNLIEIAGKYLLATK